MRLAVYQGNAEPLAFDANLALVDRAAEEASAGGAELLLTPELFVTGYAPALISSSVTPADVARLAGKLTGIAGRHGIGLLYSLPGPGPANDRGITATLVDAAGAALASYTKTHLFGPAERAAFRPGVDAPAITTFGGTRVGIALCYDIEFPEVARAAALRGAELLLVPTALGAGFENVCTVLVPARALENSLTVAYANHSGIEDDFLFAGSSVIADPAGEIVARAGTASEIIYGEVRPAEPEVDYLRDRRADLYPLWDVSVPSKETP